MVVITNMTVVLDLDKVLDLENLSQTLDNVRFSELGYERTAEGRKIRNSRPNHPDGKWRRKKRQFYSLVWKIWGNGKGNPTALVYTNGKIVLLGAREFATIPKAAEYIRQKLNSKEVKIGKISNLVAYHNFEQEVDLTQLYTLLQKKHIHARLDSELFHGVVAEMNGAQRALFLVNGKVQFTGCREEHELVELFILADEVLAEVTPSRRSLVNPAPAP